jgi:hypothetical protein
MVKLLQGLPTNTTNSAAAPAVGPMQVAPSRQTDVGAAGSTVGELATDINYEPNTLAPLTRSLLRLGSSSNPANSDLVGAAPGDDSRTAAPPDRAAPAVPGGAFSGSDLASRGLAVLSRFLGGTALNACTGDVNRDHPGRTIFVDFARFNGSPALILLVDAQNGALTAVAVSPECGLNGDADELGAAQVA